MKTFDVNNIQLKIQSPGMVLGDTMEQYLVSQLEKLGKTFPRIKKCEMLLQEEKNGSKKNCLAEGKLFVPGHVLFAKTREDNFKLAAKNMFDDLRDQLVKVKERFADKSANPVEEEKEESFD